MALVSRSRAMPAGGRRSKPSPRFFSVSDGSFAAGGRDAGLKAPTGRTGRCSQAFPIAGGFPKSPGCGRRSRSDCPDSGNRVPRPERSRTPPAPRSARTASTISSLSTWSTLRVVRTLDHEEGPHDVLGVEEGGNGRQPFQLGFRISQFGVEGIACRAPPGRDAGQRPHPVHDARRCSLPRRRPRARRRARPPPCSRRSCRR